MLPQIVVTQSEEALQSYVDNLITTHNIPKTSVYVLEPETKEFGIKTVKQLIEEMKYSSVNRVFVLKNFTNASVEAQNALLKTLEEHQPKDYILIHTAYAQSVLSTIASRSEVVHLDKDDSKAPKVANDALTLLFEKIMSGEGKTMFNEQFKVTTQEGAQQILNELISFLRTRLTDPPSAQLLKNTVENLYRLEHVNLAPQTAVDHSLIQLHKIGKSQH